MSVFGCNEDTAESQFIVLTEPGAPQGSIFRILKKICVTFLTVQESQLISIMTNAAAVHTWHNYINIHEQKHNPQSHTVSACVSLPLSPSTPELFRLLCACTSGQTEHCIDSKMAKTRLACLLTLLTTHWLQERFPVWRSLSAVTWSPGKKQGPWPLLLAYSLDTDEYINRSKESSIDQTSGRCQLSEIIRFYLRSSTLEMISTHICAPAIVSVATFAQQMFRDGYDMLVSSPKVPFLLSLSVGMDAVKQIEAGVLPVSGSYVLSGLGLQNTHQDSMQSGYSFLGGIRQTKTYFTDRSKHVAKYQVVSLFCGVNTPSFTELTCQPKMSLSEAIGTRHQTCINLTTRFFFVPVFRLLHKMPFVPEWKQRPVNRLSCGKRLFCICLSAFMLSRLVSFSYDMPQMREQCSAEAVKSAPSSCPRCGRVQVREAQNCSHNRDSAPGEACTPSWPYASICFDKALSSSSSRGLTRASRMSIQLFDRDVTVAVVEVGESYTTAHTSYLGGIPISRLEGFSLVLTVTINSVWASECKPVLTLRRLFSWKKTCEVCSATFSHKLPRQVGSCRVLVTGGRQEKRRLRQKKKQLLWKYHQYRYGNQSAGACFVQNLAVIVSQKEAYARGYSRRQEHRQDEYDMIGEGCVRQTGLITRRQHILQLHRAQTLDRTVQLFLAVVVKERCKLC
ncbi:hypothetical protein D9C73_017831 [Collichthys lucidus]|uniref:Uncharacterized protein n=1 Tax=Collichthys lucidus TaxID=240159 RepID=A0A4U5V7P1_COLLU|nr:hypothetical protein D9C73_017831 [Collichthys lucidus]